MEKPSLLGDSSDSDESTELVINKQYAESYDRWRQLEDKQRLTAKYGDVSSCPTISDGGGNNDGNDDDYDDNDDDYDDNDDDYDAPVVDESFYKALSLVKSRDSKMYEINNTVVPDSEVKPKTPKEKKHKPLFLKGYEVKVAIETGGKFSDYEDEQLHEKKVGYDEEQEQIRKSFTGFDLSEDDDDDDSSDILQVRPTPKAEQKEDKDYIVYLKGETQLAKDDKNEKKDLDFLRNYWNNPELSEDEKFLRDYFLNARYEEEEDKSKIIPTYEDITNDVDTESEEEAAEFEQKYNFRFEEPDSEFIRRYPRTMKDSLRKKDQWRKIKREEYAERKRLEKTQRREEIKYLKSLKRKEIEEKLNLLRETLHEDNIAFEDVDLEGDFDPAEHDKKMKKLFSDQYYDAPEEEKPSFPEDEDLDFEDWDNWTGDNDAENNNSTTEEGPHCEDPGFNMDADCKDPKLAFQKEMIGASKPRGKKKRKSHFATAVSREKPVFEPSDKSFEQYLNEYYQLDCEDFIGDLPTRFRYREVVPNDFGLSVDEILSAEDKELNKWCSVKRVCQNRTTDEEIYDVQAYKKKAQDAVKKKKIFMTLYNEQENDNTEITTKQENAKSRNESSSDAFGAEELNKVAAADSGVQSNGNSQEFAPSSNQEVKKKKKKKNKNVSFDNGVDKSLKGVSPNSTSSMHKNTDSPSPKNFKRKYEDATEGNDLLNTSAQNQKKKRKHNKGGASEFQAHNKRNGETSQLTKSSHKRKKSKPEPFEVKDKRLLLSDKRLEAYGINPKKFKNKIRFSNK